MAVSRDASSSSGPAAERLDPITFEVLRHSFVTLVDEMGVRLARAAFSPIITQGRDYSLAMFDAAGRLVAAGRWDMPVHFGTFQFTVREVMRVIGAEDINPGDIYLFNDPYTGGTHNQDVRAVRPVFYEGELFAWLVAMGHWPDVGGPIPGSYNPSARDSYSEGVRITPIKIFENDERIEPVIQLIFANMRIPAERNGDLQAQVQSLYAGEERVSALADKYGVETLRAAFRGCWDYSERMLRSYTREVPDGTYEWTDWIDQDPVHPDRPPVRIHLKLVVEGGTLLFDFRDSGGTPLGPVGSTLPATWSAVLTAVLNLFPGVPLNDGVYRLLDLETVPGSVVHLLPPTPCSGMAVGAFEKISMACLGAIGLAVPERRAACNYNLQNLTLGGRDERFGRDYVMYIWTAGGFGATARGDNSLPMHVLYGPGIRTQPVEIIERFYPILFEARGLRLNSAGAGRYRGGWGVEERFSLTHGSAHLTIMGDRERFPVWGVDGGADGPPQRLIMNPGTPEERSIGMSATDVPIRAGDTFILQSSGGGGVGDPLERDPQLVALDVSDELLTAEAAREQYAVVVERDEAGQGYVVASEETQALRASMPGATATSESKAPDLPPTEGS